MNETQRGRGSNTPVVLAVGLSAALMTLDTTVVNVALPQIGAEFNTALSRLQ